MTHLFRDYECRDHLSPPKATEDSFKINKNSIKLDELEKEAKYRELEDILLSKSIDFKMEIQFLKDKIQQLERDIFELKMDLRRR